MDVCIILSATDLRDPRRDLVHICIRELQSSTCDLKIVIQPAINNKHVLLTHYIIIRLVSFNVSAGAYNESDEAVHRYTNYCT